jgi:hypothetical protein
MIRRLISAEVLAMHDDWQRRDGQQQRAGRGRQCLHLTQEVRLHATAGRQPLRQRRAIGQLVWRELPGELAAAWLDEQSSGAGG